MLSRLLRKRKDPIMDRGSYSELSQTDGSIQGVELEVSISPLAESPADESSTSNRDHERRTDYVLVYETCKEKDEKDEESKKEAEALAQSRRSFERRLQKKGLILLHETVIAEKVTFSLHLFIFSDT